MINEYFPKGFNSWMAYYQNKAKKTARLSKIVNVLANGTVVVASMAFIYGMLWIGCALDNIFA